ncbi:MAG: hypothetical protein IPO97_10240 [Sphingomonadales bacterium]|nr:hypothetical protein [Sphingomonadales bacterium]
MMKTTAFLAAIVAATTATAATAQTFTFQSMANAPAMAMSNKAPDGRTYGAAAFSGSGETTWADGKKSKYSFKCITMSQPPHNSIFMSHMMCDVAASDGNFFVTFGCNNMSADEQGCWRSCGNKRRLCRQERWFDEPWQRRRIERHGAVERLISIRLK